MKVKFSLYWLCLLMSVVLVVGCYKFAQPAPPEKTTPTQSPPQDTSAVSLQETVQEGEIDSSVSSSIPDLHQLTETLRGYRTLEASLKITLAIYDGMRNYDSVVEGLLALGEGNHALLHLKTDQEEIKIHNSPDGRVYYLPQLNQYRKTEAAPTRKQLISTMIGGVMELPCGLLAALFEGTYPPFNHVDVHPAKCSTNSCWQVITETDNYSLQMLFSDLEPRLPLQLQIKFKAPELQKYVRHPQASITVIMEFRNWQINRITSNDVFAFVPPEGAKEETQPPSVLKGGSPAPVFSLESLSGETINLQDYLNKYIIVLDFWATWCGPCRKALPVLSHVVTQLKEKGIILFAINQREAPDRVKTFLATQNLSSVTVLLDPRGEAGALYQVSGLPKIVIIGKDGLIKTVYRGLAPNFEELIKKDLDALLH